MRKNALNDTRTSVDSASGEQRSAYESPRIRTGPIFEPVMHGSGEACFTPASGPFACEGEIHGECG